jgi:LemA protein
LAGWFGFDDITRYKANAGSENAPDVEFDFN